MGLEEATDVFTKGPWAQLLDQVVKPLWTALPLQSHHHTEKQEILG